MRHSLDPRHILRQHGIRPKKHLGQNFLVDRHALERIIAAADLQEGEAVLEIGPGVGTLTGRLLEHGARVVAVELDPQMVDILRTVIGDQPGFHLVAGDILAFSPESVFSAPYKVIANVPYYITSAIIRHLFEAAVRPSVMILTVQREVAQRVVSRERMSLLAVSVQFYGRPEIVGRIPPGAFYPPPKVDSAILKIVVHPNPPVTVDDVAGFFRVVKAGFSAPRKQLRNSLANGLGQDAKLLDNVLKKAGVDPTRRAETLALEEWAEVQRQLGLQPAGGEQ